MKKVMLIVLSMAMLVGGCSHYSRQEKKLFGAMAASFAMDGLTSDYIIGHGGHELNPWMSDRPEDTETYGFQIGKLGVFWLLGEIFPENREEIFTAGFFTAAGPVVWNTSQIINE